MALIWRIQTRSLNQVGVPSSGLHLAPFNNKRYPSANPERTSLYCRADQQINPRRNRPRDIEDEHARESSCGSSLPLPLFIASPRVFSLFFFLSRRAKRLTHFFFWVFFIPSSHPLVPFRLPLPVFSPPLFRYLSPFSPSAPVFPSNLSFVPPNIPTVSSLVFQFPHLSRKGSRILPLSSARCKMWHR